ncbi:MAG: hypothetical protein J5511_05520 [Bacilli bacterium]|nr:hypothetical protein [Bacilli bacterium]
MDKKKVALFGIAGLSLVLAASISMTIAWYNGSSYLAINQINVGLHDKKLSISTDNETFRDFIPNDELNKVGKFRAVSTMFCEDWIERKEAKPVFKGSFGTSSKDVVNSVDDANNTSGGYFSQEIFIKCDSSVYLTLDPELTTFNSDEEENLSMIQDLREKFPGLTDEEILFNLNNVVKSLRISLLVLNDTGDESEEFPDYAYYIIDPFKDKITLMGGILDTDKDGFYDYSLDKNEVLYGQSISTDEEKSVEECIVYKDPTEADEEVSTKELTCFTSGNKANVRKIDFDASFANGLAIKEERSTALEDVEEQVLIPLEADVSKRIILSFYQEGWDIENTDFVRYSHFYVNVMFKIARARF